MNLVYWHSLLNMSFTHRDEVLKSFFQDQEAPKGPEGVAGLQRSEENHR